ncbi:MAG: class I SAM-dependent DNA methyltransferase, partial [Akkermansiaceae bacterium]
MNTFISRWENSGAAERANYQMFLSELCEILEIPRPDPTSPDPEKNLYVFDRAITRTSPDGSAVTNYIDLYKAGHFVCETKQGSGGDSSGDLRSPSSKIGHGKRGSSAFDKALERAYHQGRDYITSLPASHGRPPFLIVCDVGYSIDLYSEFTCTGGRYERFPDPTHHRILLTDLREPKIRERLRLVFTDPLSLDPSKRAAEVTRDIATRLAKLAKSLEADGHDTQIIAGFLQRCLFTMFAEDIGLLPENGFRNLLEKVKSSPQGFTVLISGLWREMATGTQYSALLFQEIAYFNGGLFESTSALPLTAAQLDMLAHAAASDWSDVEPSIFGTLLTRALDSRERHKLGAEYTPRSYVERLIRPTIIEPLREEWEATRIAAASLHRDAEQLEALADQRQEEMNALGATKEAQAIGAERNKILADAKKKDAEALKLVTAFHRHLCAIKVLDPACGTANFLYVTLEHIKRLEAEVLELITALGGDATFEMNEYKVRPEQFLGLELSHNAVGIAQLVLWIGYFQWQRKTTGKADTGDRPLLPKTQSIRQQDAVLDYDERIPRKDPATGEILTIWNGHTTKPHPITGKEVPDETARTVLFDYINPRRAEWPQADYIVGNPPFIGDKRMKIALGEGYTETLRKTYTNVPDSADFVMYWWDKAAELVRTGKVRRFGFITTNSITQTFNRKVIQHHMDQKNPISLTYAIPDHPWVDGADGAAVRIAMTVGACTGEGLLQHVILERRVEQEDALEVVLRSSKGCIHSDLTIGANVGATKNLRPNIGLASVGIAVHGAGLVISQHEAEQLGYGVSIHLNEVIRPYLNGKDLTSKSRNVYLIDLVGYSEEQVRTKFPQLYQHLLINTKPERDQNSRKSYREAWWIPGEPRSSFRPALKGLTRYAVTPMTAKHRFFTFFTMDVLPDQGLVALAFDDAYALGILSSRIHTDWALAQGAILGPTPRYNASIVFDTFPFPALEEDSLKQHIRDLGERLDGHRKRQQELHPSLTLTGMYNVLEKIRAGETLNAKEKTIHD